MARGLALTAAATVSLVAFALAGVVGAATQQTPRRGGTVVVATNSLSEPNCLGWLEACSAGGATWVEKVLARPFVAGPRRLRNHLIERYELTHEPFTVTFRIRPEARWSDGVPVSARDFVFAYDTLLAHGAEPADDLRAHVRRPRAVDAKTVRFAFRARYGAWRTLLNFAPLPWHALRGADLASTTVWRDRIDDPRTGRPIGSGPFLVGSWERGKQVTLVRNPRYWGPHTAHLDRLVLRFVRTDLVQQSMRSGESDIGVIVPPSPELERDSRFRVLPARFSLWEHYEFRVDSGGHPALKNKLVRQALAYGIDRAAIGRALFGASAPTVLDSTMYLPGEPGYEPNWRRYRYRPAEARRLLERAGCSLGADGVYSCAGERMQLRFFTTAGVPPRARNLETVAAQLRRVGIDVVPLYAPGGPFFNTLLPAGEFDVALFGYAKTTPDWVEEAFRCRLSYTGYCNRLVNADFDQLDRIVLPSRRGAVANRIDRRLATDVPLLPLFQVPLAYVVRKGVEGVVPNGFGALTTSGVFWNAEDWWLDD